jgi:cardiolipin synthase
MPTNLPNLLTLSRIVAIPLMIALFWVPFPTGNWLVFGIFVAAALTDLLDGWLARRWQQVSALGRFLDPIADKLLVAAALLMLVAWDRIGGFTVLPAIVILCREILVSGLREFLAELKVRVPVSNLAKWKTTIQMTAIAILLVGDAGPEILPVKLIGEIGLWLAAALTMITGYDYLRAGLAHMTDSPPPAS